MYKLVILAILLFSTPSLAAVDAGSVGSIKGSGVLERGNDVITGDTGVTVQMQDTAVTANGRMRIDFLDETRVDLTEHARLTIDEFVYDPANDIGSLSIKASLGGVRYASGQIAKRYRQNVKIKTPSATIGVRGTDFIMVVDEMGGSMITLVPSCDTNGYCYVGEIEVQTDAGFVVMNQAFQSTMTTTRMQPPSPPLLIDANEDELNQLIIVRKRTPYEEAEEEVYRHAKRADFLGLDWLDVDLLDSSSWLDTEDLWVTALDENDWRLGDLLYDILDQLNAALAKLFEDELLRQNRLLIRPDVTTYGFDAETGIRLTKDGDFWVFEREDNQGENYLRIRMSQEYGYNLDVKQSDFEIYGYKLGVTTNNNITIKQCDNGCSNDSLFE